MRKVRRVILAGDDFGGGFERPVGVTLGALELARFAHGVLEHRFVEETESNDALGPSSQVIFERLAPLQSGPGVWALPRDTAERRKRGRRRCTVDGDHLEHARLSWRRWRRTRRPCLEPPAGGRRRRTTCPGVHVLAISCFAGRDVEQIDDGDIAFADIAERARLLELQGIERRRRQRRASAASSP